MLITINKNWSIQMPEAEQPKSTIKEIEIDGYKFTVDTDMIDDVESLEFIERIENKGQIAATLPLLKFILGDDEYRKMQAYFVSKDAEAHKDKPGYRPRMRVEKLNDVYLAIIEKFDPKD